MLCAKIYPNLIRSHLLLICLVIFQIVVSLLSPTNGQQQQESPEVLDKWRRFVQSLSAQQRSEFDRLHQEAGSLDPMELARRTQQFMGTLNADQKRAYQQIQQRGGERGGSRPPTNSPPSSRPPPAVGGRGGGGDDEKERQRQQGQQGATPSGGGSAQGFDRWINNPELSEQTRSALRKIKDILDNKSSGLDPVQKCEKIQRILRAIGTADKKRMQMPTQLVNFDCSQESQGGAENLLAAALTSSGRGGR